MAHLAASKRAVSLSGEQLRVWHAALSIFPAEIVNEATVALGLESVRFPDLADLYCRCREIALRHGVWRIDHPAVDRARITRREVVEVAERLGLEVLS